MNNSQSKSCRIEVYNIHIIACANVVHSIYIDCSIVFIVLSMHEAGSLARDLNASRLVEFSDMLALHVKLQVT